MLYIGSAKILIRIAKNANNKRPIFRTEAAISQACPFPFFIDFEKTGMKAEAKVPKTSTSNIRSGRRNAAKKRERSSGVKKCAKVLCLTRPKTLDAIIMTIMIVAADRTDP